MTQSLWFSLVAVGLFGIGVYGLLAHGHLLRRILCLNIMSNGVFLLLVAVAHRPGGPPDPVPHALVLTGIVVTVAATAFALALLRRLHREDGAARLEEDTPKPGRRP